MRRSGFTCWECLVVLVLLLLLIAIALPKLAEDRRHGTEADALRALRSIAEAQGIFREGDKEQDGNLDYGMLSELAATRLVDEELGSGQKRGYVFQATYSFATSEFLWFATADPVLPGVTGDRYFATNMAGVTFYSTRAPLPLDTSSCLLPSGDAVPG